MVQDSHNIIPVTLAVILHVLVFGSMFVAFDFTRDTPPPMQLAIKATLVTEDATLPPLPPPPPPPPPPVEQQPEPEPEIQQPDPDAEARKQAEEEKRREDERIENARIEREREAAEEEAREVADRKAAEDKARREREEEELRQRLEIERLAEAERQRQENEMERKRIEERQRTEMIETEEALLAAQNSTEMQVYLNEIRQKVRRNWRRPGTARNDLECIVAVQQVPGGEVISARVTECNGDSIVRRSVENAVFNARPLPQPENPLLFLRNFTITFTYDE